MSTLATLPARLRAPRARRASLLARWPLGLSLTSWRYMWRITPLHRHAALRIAQSGNPILRLGSRLIGRPQQLRFYRNACTRMAELVDARLRGAA